MTTRLQLAIDQIVRARRYTLELLRDVPAAWWFRMPSEGVTHLAWQVGHLAIAEHRLTRERVRGVRPDDAELITAESVRLFGKGSTPTADPESYPPPEAIRSMFDGVHERALQELAELPEAALDQPPEGEPSPAFRTKYEALIWCAHHEMLHAGQIGLLRRLFGSAPLR